MRNKKIGEPIKSAIDVFLKKVEDKNMFLCSICEKTETDGIWSPLEPDLLGEFFVLEFLREKRQNYDDEYISNFSDICWENSSLLFVLFLSRCVQNYCRQERFNTIFANGMEIFEPKDEENAVWYSYILVNMSAYQTEEKAGEAVKKLEIVNRNYPINQEVRTTYAKGLVNLSNKQELKEREKTIEELKNLSESAPENQEVRTAYANGLFNLSRVQERKERKKTIEELKKLSEPAPKNQETQTAYAKGLFNLSRVQELKERKTTIEKLKELWESDPENKQVLTVYANGLASLGALQKLSEIEDTIDKLKNLKSIDPQNLNIQTAYMIGVINMTLKKAKYYKTKESIESDIVEIKKYVEEHKDNEELQKIYNLFLDFLNRILP